MHIFRNTMLRACSALCFLSFLAAGCVSTDEVGRLQWELNTLKSEMQQIRKTSKTMETQIPGQTRQLDTKLTEMEEQQAATAKTVSDLLIDVQDLRREFQKLTGQVEESRYFTEKSASGLIQEKEQLNARLRELELAVGNLMNKNENTAALSTTEPSPGSTPKGTGILTAPAQKGSGSRAQKDPADMDAGELYRSAYQAYSDGRTEEAREQFISLLGRFPNNQYGDNARFWIAESYYREGNYEDAILAYEELFKENPSSDKIPGAMLKQGLAFYELKDQKTGSIVLEKLIEKYPQSEQAKVAMKKLNRTVPRTRIR